MNIKSVLEPYQDDPAEPAKRRLKWSPEEDATIIRLRQDGMKWEDISKHLPGRSAISCRLHYQNYLEKNLDWDEESKTKMARLYERLREEMWSILAKEMGMPWRAVEAMHWEMGEAELRNRAARTHISDQGRQNALPGVDAMLSWRPHQLRIGSTSETMK